jgi:hypothetical protein
MPPPPGEDPALVQEAPAQEAPAAVPPQPRERKGITGPQLDAIRDIKANPETRESWYVKLEAAVKNNEIQVRSIVTTLKTAPENLSLAAASTLLKYAPMRNPDAPATLEQVEAATMAHNHMVQAPALVERVKSADPALYEKLQATGAASLTKKEASDLIGCERAYNQEIANRPASEAQVRSINETLEKHPALEEKLSKGFIEARANGTLTHSDMQYFIRKDRDLVKEQNQVVLSKAMDLMKDIAGEAREAIAKTTLSRIEEKAGHTFKAEALNYVIKHVNNLLDMDAPEEDRKAAVEYFLGFENAQALHAAASMVVA